MKGNDRGPAPRVRDLLRKADDNRNHIFPALTKLLIKKGYGITVAEAGYGFLNTDQDLNITKRITTEASEVTIKVKYRPNRSKYYYSLETTSGSHSLAKESRRFRYKSPDEETICSVVDYLYKKLVEEEVYAANKAKERELLEKRRVQDAKEIGRAIHANVITNVVYGTFSFCFKTIDGTEIMMNFHLNNDGDVRDFDVVGTIKRHHFYAIIDGLRKSVPDCSGESGFVKKRRIDLTSDSVMRISKNDSIKNIGFSKIRSWNRNFNLAEEK